MKKVSGKIQARIVEAYLAGISYKWMEKVYGVNRWNIQDALSKAGVKTNRIKSPPRLPGKKKVVQKYHDIDYLPPMKVNQDNPVLESDLDIMERMDDVEDANDFVAESGSHCEIVIDDNGEVRYRKYD